MNNSPELAVRIIANLEQIEYLLDHLDTDVNTPKFHTLAKETSALLKEYDIIEHTNNTEVFEIIAGVTKGVEIATAKSIIAQLLTDMQHTKKGTVPKQIPDELAYQ
jgi:hypothetical protein